MKPTLNEKFLAWLALLSGISLSIVAEYYSILGLTAIFAAAVLPVVIMGIVLGVGKVSATLWLKQNWKDAPWSIRIYLSTAIAVLMIVTSMGSFGFLSKAHSDQNLVSGDVMAKIAVYDEKIKTERENIDANRKALKQLDESVDQVMGRSPDEKGAEKAVAIRRAQQKERSRLAQDITESQKKITALNEERAPIAAEVRKVEAEVGPIKYIASFVYGATDPSVLERAVTWVIILIIIVFDPLAVVLLLSSQISFQNFREREGTRSGVLVDREGTIIGLRSAEGNSPIGPVVDIVSPDTTVTESPTKVADEPGPIERTVFEPKDNAPAYVQNEEQATSNLWSSTTDTISQTEYLNTSMRKLEDHIDEVANLVKTGFLSIDEVPKSILNEVNLKLNAR